MTSNASELKFQEQISKPKETKADEPKINEAKEKSDGFVLDDWD